MGYTFVLGGARSGKSSFAEQLALRISEIHSMNVTYVATAHASDDEMEERIQRHRLGRPSQWDTAEIPLDVSSWLQTERTPQVILIDCLSLLLNNWMFLEGCDEEQVLTRIDALVAAMAESEHRVIVVSNEVGQGIVPGDGVSRRYRDWLGVMNQKTAQCAEKVIWVVVGIPVDLRKLQVSLP